MNPTLPVAEFPDKVAPIFTPAPYKTIYGGRGKGASWTFARAALILGSHRKLFVVCGREVQKSIKDSVHKLLADQIEVLGLQGFYDVLDVEIRGKNDTTFAFVGLNNVNSLKSAEGIDILWVTEAVHVPKSKWTVLLPTVRRDPPAGPFKQGSEIWVDLNPELTTDDTYKMFVVDPPEGSVVIEMNYRDNPFFPEILRKQMLEMRKKDYDEYLTVWEGKTRKSLSGAIYAKELRVAIEDNRIGPHIRYDKSRPVVLTFDLGDEDVTTMWAWQQIGNQHNAIFYHEESGQPIEYFLRMAQDRHYMVKGVWLPHDAKQAHQAARRLAQNTIEKQARAFYPTPGVVKIVPQVRKAVRINAVRSLFSRVCINDVDCSGGIMALQHYQFEVDPITHQRSSEPMHNWASHGADGFGGYAVQLKEGNKKAKEEDTDEANIERDSKFRENHAQSWMAS